MQVGGAGLGRLALHSRAPYQQHLERILIDAKISLLRANSRPEVVAVIEQANERLTDLELRVRRESPESAFAATIALERRRLQEALR